METKRKWYIALFWLYGGVMLVLLFHREPPARGLPYLEELTHHLSMTPFETIRRFWGLLSHPRQDFVRVAVVNLAGNVILFLPLGYLLPAVFHKLKNFWKAMAVSALLIAAVELGQLVTLLGTCDIDDWILNLIGAGLGYGIFRLASKKPKPTTGE